MVRKMNILILSGSPRKGGNTDLLVEAFVKGAVRLSISCK